MSEARRVFFWPGKMARNRGFTGQNGEIHGFYQGKLWFNHVEPRKMWVLHTLKYEGSRMGTPPGGKFWGSNMGCRYHCRTLTSPHCRTLEVLVPRVVFFWYCNLLFLATLDFYGSCGSSYLESGAHRFGHCPRCPELLSLENVPFWE